MEGSFWEQLLGWTTMKQRREISVTSSTCESVSRSDSRPMVAHKLILVFFLNFLRFLHKPKLNDPATCGVFLITRSTRNKSQRKREYIIYTNSINRITCNKHHEYHTHREYPVFIAPLLSLICISL